MSAQMQPGVEALLLLTECIFLFLFVREGDRAADSNEYMRSLEKSFAFERAAGVIESECCPPSGFKDDFDWWDLDSADLDLSQEIDYLDSRRLLLRHPDHPNWVVICDEDEPLPEAPAVAADAFEELT